MIRPMAHLQRMMSVAMCMKKAAYSCNDTNRYYEGFINVTKRHNRITTSIREKANIHSFAAFFRREDKHHLTVGGMAEEPGSSEHLALGIPQYKGRKFSAFAQFELMHHWFAGFDEKTLFLIKINNQWHLDKINEAIAALREGTL